MYEEYFGFKEKPFSLLPDPSFLYMTKSHSMALTMLEYSLTNDSAGICVISGEIGSGKTTLIRKLLNNMDAKFTTGLLTNTHSEFGDLLQWVLMAFGLDYHNKGTVELYETFVNFTIQKFAQGKRTVLIIDEAQNLSFKALEVLRMLTNINSDKNQVLQLIMVGQPELRDTFRAKQLEQLNQRVTVNYHMNKLNQQDGYLYIRHRLKIAGGEPDLFSGSACKAVWYYSRGIPRVMNTLCDTALVYAFADQKSGVDIKLVNEIVNERKGSLFYAKEQDLDDQEMNLDDNKQSVING